MKVLMCALLWAGLAGCGGGGSESGKPDEIEVTPKAMKVTGPGPGQCAKGGGLKVFVHGGLPPYKLFNTLPSGIRLSTNVVQRSGESFEVFFTGQCFDTLPIKVEDALGQFGEISLSNQLGTAAPAPLEPSV